MISSNYNKGQEKDIVDHCESNEEVCSKIDASGTDPNRYKNLSVNDSNDTKGNGSYEKQPDNHPSESERLIHPDKGNN